MGFVLGGLASSCSRLRTNPSAEALIVVLPRPRTRIGRSYPAPARSVSPLPSGPPPTCRTAGTRSSPAGTGPRCASRAAAHAPAAHRSPGPPPRYCRACSRRRGHATRGSPPPVHPQRARAATVPLVGQQPVPARWLPGPVCGGDKHPAGRRRRVPAIAFVHAGQQAGPVRDGCQARSQPDVPAAGRGARNRRVIQRQPGGQLAGNSPGPSCPCFTSRSKTTSPPPVAMPIPASRVLRPPARRPAPGRRWHGAPRPRRRSSGQLLDARGSGSAGDPSAGTSSPGRPARAGSPAGHRCRRPGRGGRSPQHLADHHQFPAQRDGTSGIR